MTNHFEILRKGIEEWNQWRSTSRERVDLKGVRQKTANLQGIDLRGADLRGADLRGADLRGTQFEKADLRQARFYMAKAQKADFQEACLDGADLHMAVLSEAEFWRASLEGADLRGANIRSAKMRRADLSSARLENCNLEDADLQRAIFDSAGLRGANLKGANLFETDFSRGDLREVKGMKPNSTLVRQARFSPKAKDPWSALRMNYTGSKLLFHLLFLILFFAPYFARTMMWRGVNSAQETIAAATQELKTVASELSQKEDPTAEVTSKVVSDLSGIQPCLAEECVEYPVWLLLIGADQRILFMLMAIALLVYNVCRAVLTTMVGPLRDEEERSGHTPPIKGRFGYGWLVWPHKVVDVLFYVAMASFIIHGVRWMTTQVLIPASFVGI